MHPEFIKAEELLKSGRYDEALKSFNKSISEEPANAIYYSQRGVCYYHLKNLEAALDDMNTSVKLDPLYSYRYASRAYIKDAKGDVLGAIEDYKKATELDPEDAVSFNNLGLLEEKLGYMEASKKNFKKADELAKLLEGTGVVTEEELLKSSAEKPKNIQKEIEEVKDSQMNSSVAKEIGNVFKKKDVFKEFLAFIKSGFKHKE